MKISLKEHQAIEKKETPEFEAKEHSKHFLKKAEKLANGKHKVEKQEKKSPRKKG